MPPVGEYRVKVSLTGLSSQERAGLVFTANSAPVIDFTLHLAALAETVSVRSEAPLLETRRSELSVTVDQKRIETMPLNGRNYMDLAQLSIGVHTAAARGDISINGQLGRNIDYVIDGVSNKVNEWGDASKTGLSLDISQEFQIISSQFSAEFGNALGGIVSAVTKSGTNDLHGTAFLYERPGRLDANDRLSQTKAPFDQQQFGSTFSGPIIKNRTHFFGAYEGTNQDSKAVRLAPDVVRRRRLAHCRGGRTEPAVRRRRVVFPEGRAGGRRRARPAGQGWQDDPHVQKPRERGGPWRQRAARISRSAAVALDRAGGSRAEPFRVGHAVSGRLPAAEPSRARRGRPPRPRSRPRARRSARASRRCRTSSSR